MSISTVIQAYTYLFTQKQIWILEEPLSGHDLWISKKSNKFDKLNNITAAHHKIRKFQTTVFFFHIFQQ